MSLPGIWTCIRPLETEQLRQVFLGKLRLCHYSSRNPGEWEDVLCCMGLIVDFNKCIQSRMTRYFGNYFELLAIFLLRSYGLFFMQVELWKRSKYVSGYARLPRFLHALCNRICVFTLPLVGYDRGFVYSLKRKVHFSTMEAISIISCAET